MKVRKCDCVSVALSNLFAKLGRLIAKYPLPFLIAPVVVSIGLGFGLINLQTTNDSEYLYTPVNAPSKDERKLFQDTFTEDDATSFISTRRSQPDGDLIIIFKGKNGGDIHTTAAFQEILALDEDIKSQTFSISGEQLRYEDLCAKWQGTCASGDILRLYNNDANNVGTVNLSYPLYRSGADVYYLGYSLGGVDLNDAEQVQSAEAVMITYNFRYTSDDDKSKTDDWVTEILDYLDKYDKSSFTVTKFTFRAYISLDLEIAKSADKITPFFAITYTILINFSILVALMSDWVRAKPWAAFGGVMAACLAIVSGLGLMAGVGVPFATTVATVPFLIVGIGIDDMFVILACWRHTDARLSNEERMAETFRTAAVSITLTSITDALAFLIGAVSTFRSITLFCAYSGVAVLFSYIYAITFFGACLAYCGRREEARKHGAAICKKTITKKEAEDAGKGSCYVFWCTGGDHTGDTASATKAQENGDVTVENGATPAPDSDSPIITRPFITNFLGQKFAPILMTTPMKVVVLVVYAVYLGFTVWGCVTLREGLDLRRLAPDGSYVVGFYDDYDQYFYEIYGPNVMIAFTEPIDYSDNTVRDEVYAVIDTFRNNKYFLSGEENLQSWLHSFENSLSSDPASLTDYISQLKTFLATNTHFSLDVNFNSDDTQIISSRMLVQAKGIQDTLDEREMMLAARDLAKDASFEMTAYFAAFIYYDQFVVILQNTLQSLAIAIACMLFVAILLIPSISAIVWTTLSVASICAGVIGFMTFWGVNLDSISMINLIMCIGFSVDFAAHISYHFAISHFRKGDKKAIDAIDHLGTPVLMGAVSTILGVAVLAGADTYIFRTFFKLIFLVMVFGFFHALFVLPIVLSVFTCAGKSSSTTPSPAHSSPNVGVENKGVNTTNEKDPRYKVTLDI